MICRKRIFALTSAFLILISTAGCGTTKANSEVPSSASSQISGTKVHVATLKGPTGFGMLQMMDQAASENPSYEFSVDTAPDEIVSALASGNADIARWQQLIPWAYFGSLQMGKWFLLFRTLKESQLKLLEKVQFLNMR